MAHWKQVKRQSAFFTDAEGAFYFSPLLKRKVTYEIGSMQVFF